MEKSVSQLEMIREYVLGRIANIPHTAAQRSVFDTPVHMVDKEGTILREDGFSVRSYRAPNKIWVKEIALHVLDLAALIEEGSSYDTHLLQAFMRGGKIDAVSDHFWNRNVFNIDYTKPLPAISVIARKTAGGGQTDRINVSIHRTSITNIITSSFGEFGDVVLSGGHYDLSYMVKHWNTLRIMRYGFETSGRTVEEFGQELYNTILGYMYDRLLNKAAKEGIPLIYTPNHNPVNDSTWKDAPRPRLTGAARTYESLVNLRNAAAYADGESKYPVNSGKIAKFQKQSNKNHGREPKYGASTVPTRVLALYEGRISKTCETESGRNKMAEDISRNQLQAIKLFRSIPDQEPEIFIRFRINTAEAGGYTLCQLHLDRLDGMRALSPIYRVKGDLQSFLAQAGEFHSSPLPANLIRKFWSDYLKDGEIPLSYFEMTVDLRENEQRAKEIVEKADPRLVKQWFPYLEISSSLNAGRGR